MTITVVNPPHGGDGPDAKRRGELLDEACRVLRATVAKERSRVDTRLLYIVADYKRAMENNTASPKLSDARKTLKEISDMAKKLAQRIKTALPKALPYGTATFGWEPQADDPELDLLASLWETTGDQLERLAKETQNRSDKWKLKGGRGLTVESNRHGPPLWRLSMLCYDLFTEIRNEPPTPTLPGKAATGKFSELVYCAHELATGTEKIPASLNDAIVEVCKARGKRSNGFKS